MKKLSSKLGTMLCALSLMIMLVLSGLVLPNMSRGTSSVSAASISGPSESVSEERILGDREVNSFSEILVYERRIQSSVCIT